ncbi:hypothetical protein JL108_14440 [Aeromicrobium sp. YIM 150415]|uniref:hypothetical protein n=1 Tax=Aeromicrobium sp. YIM 150415 TaxID=2803912 RepID=UPI001963C12B|nr:hypothetical protein [Aeromicrobium sp. YIM 150415]MBM9464652.1 hypothetical protein [Aeromicrobium sp. YIM 150415]
MSTTPTPKQIEAFKHAWRVADLEGREGERVRDGLAAALAAADATSSTRSITAMA